MPDAFRSLACPSCPRYHTGARGMLCCRCWERLTPEGRAYKASRVRETRARAKARAEAAAAALEQHEYIVTIAPSSEPWSTVIVDRFNGSRAEKDALALAETLQGLGNTIVQVSCAQCR